MRSPPPSAERGDLPGGDRSFPQPAVDAELWYRAIYDTPLLLAGIADVTGRVVDANRLSVEGLGLSRSEVIGQLFWEGPWWGADDGVRAAVRSLCLQAVEQGGQQRAESSWWMPDGSEHWVDLAVYPLTDLDGRPAYLFLSGLDITEQVAVRRAAAASAEQAALALEQVAEDRAESIRVLQAAEVDLASNLQLFRHILDSVADGIYGLDHELRVTFSNRSATDMLGFGADELLGQDFHALVHRLPDGSDCPVARCPAARALLSGTIVASEHETFRRSDGRLMPIEVVAVPTITDGWISGVVVSFRDLTDRLAAERQSEQLRAVTRREAAQRALTDQLQQALLSPPPTPPGLEIAVRYRAAAQEAGIGGDWYDAFLQPDGTVVLVIGDVVGHDSSAAATMSQLRGLLRGIAYGAPDSPAGLLTRLEASARGLGLDALATVVLACVHPEISPQGKRRVVWSNAGHLPPAVLDADGTVTVTKRDPDLLVGVVAGAPRCDHTLDLAVGSALVIYTDGLIERRDFDLDHGFEALADALSDLSSFPLGELCDTVLDRLLPHAADDDVALLAIR